MPDDPELKRVLWYVLGGSRGGENRARIINELRKRPMNMNQLAEKLSVDYRTIMHHVGVLASNSLVVTRGEKYGAMYFISPRLEAGIEILVEVCNSLRFKLEPT
ncbi:MAG: winged helix-turn-helix domain-containing protein [Nitrososphaerales archaeon]|nr:winged helix-turn-helix domain-containing protein [Nitrososphaerales archaeon]